MFEFGIETGLDLFWTWVIIDYVGKYRSIGDSLFNWCSVTFTVQSTKS